jgi:hypothetical protein
VAGSRRKYLLYLETPVLAHRIFTRNNSPTCLSRGFEVSYTRDEDFPEPPASRNPNPECTRPRTRVTNIKEYYFCNVRAVRQQFYLIYCLFSSYANVNNYVSLCFRYPLIVRWDPAPRSVPTIIHILCIYCISSFVCVIFMFLLFLF